MGSDQERQAAGSHAPVLDAGDPSPLPEGQAERLLAVGVRLDDDRFLVTDGFGEQMRPQALSRAFGRFAAERGFDLPRFHGLRHTAAILMLTSGVDVKTTASRLGHANPALLFSTYSHFIESADQAAAERLDSLLGQSSR